MTAERRRVLVKLSGEILAGTAGNGIDAAALKATGCAIATGIPNATRPQTSVTSKLKPPYHSMYLGARSVTPRSMKSKSRMRFNAAMMTTAKEKPIPTSPAS